MSGGDRQGWRDTVVLLLLAAAGTALGTAVRRGPTVVQDAALVVEVIGVIALVVLAIRWALRRRRSRRVSPDERRPAPAYGSAQWSAQRRPWALVAAPFYGLYLGWSGGAVAWWLPFAVFLGALVLGIVVRVLLCASRGRRWAAARASFPGAAVALVAVDPVAGMRLQQWSKAAGTAVPSFDGGDAVLAADDDGVALGRLDKAGHPVHFWAWDDVELSRTSSSTALPHLVLTLLGPPPAARARAVPAGRRRFDLTLTVRTIAVGSLGAAEVATAAALDELVSARSAPAGSGSGSW